MRWFGAPAPDTQTGVTRRHRPSKFCGRGPDAQKGNCIFQAKPLSHRVGHKPEQYRKTAQRTMWAGFAALGRSRLNCRKHNWTAPVELTAVQPSPWLYRESTAPLESTQETKQREKGPSQYSQRGSHQINKTQTNQQTNEFKRGTN